MSGLRQDDIKIKNEYFTLGTLAMFYADAAKAGGMEYYGYTRWDEVFNGPNLISIAADWRPKPAQPMVRWVIQLDDGTIHSMTFETEKYANIFKESISSTFPNAKVIKLTEEQS